MADLMMPVNYTIIHDDPSRGHAISEEELHVAQAMRYDTITSPITNDESVGFRLRTIEETGHVNALPSVAKAPRAGVKVPLLLPSDTALSPGAHVSRLVLKTSPRIDLMNSDRRFADLSKEVLVQEVSYAAWCGASNVLIKGPTPSSQSNLEGVVQYARGILSALGAGAGFHVQIKLPMSFGQPTDDRNLPGRLNEHEVTKPIPTRTGVSEQWSSWDAWNAIRTVCKYDPRLSLALIVPKALPSGDLQSRWLSEPTRMLFFPDGSFVVNKKNYKVLSLPHQDLVRQYMQSKNPPWIVLSDIGPLPETPDQTAARNPTPAESSRPTASPQVDNLVHLEYFRKHIQAKQPLLSAQDRYAIPYQDYLQDPLQPLTDNLESATYEVFEKDKVKYEAYERAIKAALEDRFRLKKATSDPRSGDVVAAVVGAGRGPLVDCAIRAADALNQPLQIWAVEKNPSAVVHLKRRNELEWSRRINVIHSDMRTWKGPVSGDDSYHKVDIVISELLGSFGDNELSPECLDGVGHLLNPQHGISIPSSYSAFMTPIAAPKLHTDVLARSTNRVSSRDPSQTPYVVWLHSSDFLSTEIKGPPPEGSSVPVVKKAWTFSHPPPVSSIDSENSHNKRFATHSFPCPNRGVCHGLAGYFEAVLCSPVTSASPKIELSTNPTTMSAKSPNMKSWFPIFFPLKTPLYFPDDSMLIISIWRQTNGRRVWYEWVVESYLVVGEGRKVKLGCSELHSSVEAACLM